MRTSLLKLAVVCLVLLAVANPPCPVPPPIVTPSATPVADWSVLRTKLDEQAFREAAAVMTTTVRAQKAPRSQRVVYGSGACGGDLPPCSVLACESHGNLVAQNPHSTASGKWQILDSTWAGYGGYERAMYAPEEVQDGRAREIYRNGAGRSAWVC